MSKYFLILWLAATILSVNSYKILAIFPSKDRTSFVTYRELIRELANRNHEVTLISHFQIPNAPDTYNEVLLNDNQAQKGLSFESVIANEVSRVPFETLVATKSGNDDCKILMNNSHVLHMIRTRPKFDVILVESYNSDCGIALAANFTAPYIGFNPQTIQPWQYNRLGVHFNPATVPQATVPYGREPWFFDRVKSYLLYHITNWVYYVGSQVTDHVYLYKYLGDDLPSLETLASNASLLFVNSHPSVFGGVARPDNVIDIGGIHVRPPKVIPTEIDRFINEAEHGVIYVNLGSTSKDSTLPEDKLQELLSTFRKLPMRVLWKWDGRSIENLPRNVLTLRWFPQYDVLKHDNVKAFITHAGILSTIEAVDSGKPVVAIPLFGDQHGNAAALRDVGVATVVHYDELKKEILMNAIDEVLEERTQQRARQLSRIWHDRPVYPMESAIYWTEYVARYQGAPNLQPNARLVPTYQAYQIDVLAFIALVVYILTRVLYKILSFCCCCCCHNDAQAQAEYVEDRRSKRVKFE